MTGVRKAKVTDGELELKRALIEQIGSGVRTGLMAAAAVGVAWCFKESIAVLAGHTTDANIAVSILNKTEISVTLAWTLAISGAWLGARERKLRKSTVKKLEAQIREYELLLHPKRTSSSLTATGDTNPKDV